MTIDSTQPAIIIDEIDLHRPVLTVVATMEGVLIATKVEQNRHKLERCGRGFIQYLQLIRKQG